MAGIHQSIAGGDIVSKQELKCPRCNRYLGKAPRFTNVKEGETLLLKCPSCKWVDVPLQGENTNRAA